MGKTAKLHRRLVKKSQQAKLHARAVRSLLEVIAIYANSAHWAPTETTRDIKEGGVIVGQEILKAWRGPGSGPDLAAQFMKEVSK